MIKNLPLLCFVAIVFTGCAPIMDYLWPFGGDEGKSEKVEQKAPLSEEEYKKSFATRNEAIRSGDFGRGREISQELCERGRAEGCMVRGWLYLGGRGEERDEARAKEYLGRACEGGSAVGCHNLAALYGEDAKALSLYEKACTLGANKSCAKAGLIHSNAGDESAASGFWERACNGGNADACAFLARDFELGEGAKQDKNKAKELYAKACQMGDGVSCERVKKLEKTNSNLKKKKSKSKTK